MATIVLTGGGSGGHITPILAVADALKQKNPSATIIYIGYRGDGLRDIPREHPTIDRAHFIFAGKFRRYHKGGLRQLLDIATLLKNVRDMVLVLVGLVQSIVLLNEIKPDVVFIRGGFVGVPVGKAASWRKIPYITHDSDVLPSLANRLVGKRAAQHAVALPVEMYPMYEASKTIQVGTPLSENFEKVTPELQLRYRKAESIPTDAPVVCVTGGGLGARRLNHAVVSALPTLFEAFPTLYVIHVTGRELESETRELYELRLSTQQIERVRTIGFSRDFYRLSGAADLIVARAGATNLAEFAVQGKACIIVPNPQLPGGHQTKNAHSLAERGAIISLSEADIASGSALLARTITDVLSNPKRRRALETSIKNLAQPHAAQRIADLLLAYAEGRGK